MVYMAIMCMCMSFRYECSYVLCQVRELVRAVQPDVVGVELCKDRVPLLVDDSSDTISNLLWHSRKVNLD